MKNTFRFGFGVVLSLFFISCASGPYTPASDPKSPEAAGQKVVLLDEFLEDRIAVDLAPVSKRDGQDRLMVQASLRNRTEKALSIQVQVLFKGAQGMVLYSDSGAEMPWQPLILSANETKSLTQTALTSEASQYTIRVRLMNRPKNS